MNKVDLVKRFCSSPVCALPVLFERGSEPRVSAEYLSFLKEHGTKTVMTTAGTSNFYKMSYEQLLNVNKLVGKESGLNKILGLLPTDTQGAILQAKLLNQMNLEDAAIMPLYPDRYYDDEMIIKYFYAVADCSKYPVFIHGMFMRSATGGTYNFSSELINKIKEHPKIIGMKEETRDLGGAFDIVKKTSSEDFGIIVAGGSQRRFAFLHPAGAHTFLTGVGNLIPEADFEFQNLLNDNNYLAAKKLMNYYEVELFDVFMRMGWHKALSIAMNHFHDYSMGIDPIPKVTEDEREIIIKLVNKLRKKYYEK